MNKGERVITRSPEETESLGERLSATLKEGDRVALIGDLGGGKTRFVRGIARGLGSRGFIKSPSFTIMNIYQGGRLPLYHIDLYRIGGDDEFFFSGLEEFIYGKGVSVIEWAERHPALIRDCMYVITFKYLGENEREIIIEERGVTER
ncbi:MAG: tRNA (adenosine(37)-N6)-threonylcarbamoyltransferase complex ATPase subunit type 1 TsaE [Deltaproteobacteria bacterium]|nr:tRNA (adenosine(37)-N6)-threonylcarbamoyltransferase complex ATPase subunit type 1 TsaE [Deltaproteobacteria bacterium]